MSTWCSKHVEARNKLTVKQKFRASICLITEIKKITIWLYSLHVSAVTGHLQANQEQELRYIKIVPTYRHNDARIPLLCCHIHNTISVWTIVRHEYNSWKFIFIILPYHSTVLIISKNFHILSMFNANEIGSQWVRFFMYLNSCS